MHGGRFRLFYLEDDDNDAMLINRALLRTADYPGTCAFHRATMLRVGHYDGDVLFDNEEIIRGKKRKGREDNGTYEDVEKDKRCTSIKEAVKFAKSNNLLGVICDATLLVSTNLNL